MTDKILVFVPMYNCAPQISRVLAQLHPYETARLFHGLICVDNRSTDNTLTTAVEALEDVPLAHRAVLKNDDNYGLGGSHKVAIRYALDNGYTHLVVLHGDDQGNIADLVPHIAQGRHVPLDALLGARFMKGSKLIGYSFIRTLANRIFNLIFSAAAGVRLYDLGSGLNLYKVSIFKDGFYIKYRDDLSFNYFLILGGCLKNLKQEFFPLTWREDDQISNAKLFRQGSRMLRLLAQRIFNPTEFMTAEHREFPREGYTSTAVKVWGE
jgi:dolichol-phosphate mannosyltransferase